eukprot:1565096-Pleurochrysis_carterae.AAC.1
MVITEIWVLIGGARWARFVPCTCGGRQGDGGHAVIVANARVPIPHTRTLIASYVRFPPGCCESMSRAVLAISVACQAKAKDTSKRNIHLARLGLTLPGSSRARSLLPALFVYVKKFLHQIRIVDMIASLLT